MDILDLHALWTPFTIGDIEPPEAIGLEMALDNSRPHYRLSPAKVHYALTQQAAHYRAEEGR